MADLNVFLKTSITETSPIKIHNIALYCNLNLRIYNVILYHLTKSNNTKLRKYYKEKRNTCLTILENITENKNTINRTLDIIAAYNIMVTHISTDIETIHKQVMFNLNNEYNTYILAALENKNTSHNTLMEIYNYPQYQNKIITHPNYIK